jgi:apolipoprotein N-acyltransferase
MSQPAAVPRFDPYSDSVSFWKKNAEWLWAAAVGALTVVLTIVCFPPWPAPEFAYAFAAPGILWAYRRPRLKTYAITMFIAQAVAWTSILAWLHHVSWLGLLLLGPFVGAWVGLFYLAAWWFMPRLLGRQTALRIAAMFGLAAFWVLLEWTRTWFLSGFPWLPLAASQWQRTTILQIASYTGAGGVSFILISFNLGFAAYAHRLFFEKQKGLRRRSPEFMAALLVLMFPSFLLLREVYGQERLTIAKVAVVQPDIPQTLKWDESKADEIFDILSRTTLQAAGTAPDFILWPEAATPYAVRGHEAVRGWVEELAKRARVPLVIGSLSIERDAAKGEEVWQNGAFVIDPVVGLQTASYAKRHLVPFGEYVPFRPVLGWLTKVVPVSDGDFQPGEGARTLVVPTRAGSVAVGPLICYEDIFPQLARDSVQTGSEVLLVLTNNGWFGKGGAAYQHAAHSVLRAVELRRPVVRCGNAGWSGVIDEFGAARGVMTSEEHGVYFRGTKTFSLTRDRHWIGRNSYYTEHGDWFVIVCVVLLAFGATAAALGKPVPSDDATDASEAGDTLPPA